MNHCWQTVFPFFLPGSANRKKTQAHEFFISIWLHYKASHFKCCTIPFKSIFLKKIRFEENLDEVLKKHRQQNQKTQNDNINTKQNSFYINSVFLFSKTYYMIQKLLYTDFYLLDVSIEDTVWSVWKKDRGSDHIHPSLRCTFAFIQSQT